MLDNTINKTVDILQGLTQKIINIKQKSEQCLTNENYTDLNDKLNTLSAMFNSNNDIEEPDEESQTIKGYKVINDTDTRIIGDFLDNGTTLNGYPVYTFNTYSLECNNNPGGDVMPAWRVADSNGTVIYFGQGLTPDTVSWYSLPMSDYSLTVPKFETIY